MIRKLFGAAAVAAMIACASAPAAAKPKDDGKAADKEAKDAKDKADKEAKDKADKDAKDKADKETKDKADKDAKSDAPDPVLPGSTACSFAQISPAASACSGWYEGNLNGGSDDKNDASADALNALLGVDSFTGDNLTFIENLGSISGNVIDFGTPLFGDTVFSFHVGAANGQQGSIGYTGTGFFRFDAGNLAGGLDVIGLNVPGLSNARLYRTGSFQTIESAVPEPATWAMMIIGFGAIGLQIRRRRRATLGTVAA